MREIVALQKIDPQFAAGLVLLGRLDSLGDGPGVDLRGQLDQHLDEVLLDRLARQRRDQAFGDLQIVRRQGRDRFQRRVTRSGIVDRDFDSFRSKFIEKIPEGLESSMAARSVSSKTKWP